MAWDEAQKFRSVPIFLCDRDLNVTGEFSYCMCVSWGPPHPDGDEEGARCFGTSVTICKRMLCCQKGRY